MLFSWAPHPLPLPTSMGRGKYLNYDTVSRGEDIVLVIFSITGSQITDD